jgi:transposase
MATTNTIVISVGSASPPEITLVEDILEVRFTKELPDQLIGDKAYDSDPLDERLKEKGVQRIAPHKMNRKKEKTQDGRPLRRYRKRWKIERLFARLQNFRRILVRYDRLLVNYLAFVQLGRMMILPGSYF